MSAAAAAGAAAPAGNASGAPRTAEALLAAARRRAAAEAGAKAGGGPSRSPPPASRAAGRAPSPTDGRRALGGPHRPTARARAHLAQARIQAAGSLRTFGGSGGSGGSGGDGSLAASPRRGGAGLASPGGSQRDQSDAALVALHARCRGVQRQLEEAQELQLEAEGRAEAAEAEAAGLRSEVGAREEAQRLDARRQDGAQRGLEGQLQATQERVRDLEQRAEEAARNSALREAESAREAATLSSEARRLAGELHAAQEANRGGATQLSAAVAEVERLRVALTALERAKLTAEQDALAARAELQRASAGMQTQALQLQELVRRAKSGMAEQLATAQALLEAAAQKHFEAGAAVLREAEQRAEGLRGRLEGAEEQLRAVETLRVSEGETLELAMEWSEIVNGRIAELSDKMQQLGEALQFEGSASPLLSPGGGPSPRGAEGPSGARGAREVKKKVKSKSMRAAAAKDKAARERLLQLALPKARFDVLAAARHTVRGDRAGGERRKKKKGKTKKAAGRNGGRALSCRSPFSDPRPRSPAGARAGPSGPVGFASGAVRLTSPAPESERRPRWASPRGRRSGRGRPGASGEPRPSKEGLRLLGALQGELEELSMAHAKVMEVFDNRGFVSSSPGRSAVERQLEGVGTLRDLQSLAGNIQSKVEQVATLRQHLAGSGREAGASAGAGAGAGASAGAGVGAATWDDEDAGAAEGWGGQLAA